MERGQVLGGGQVLERGQVVERGQVIERGQRGWGWFWGSWVLPSPAATAEAQAPGTRPSAVPR